jgi:hypothetical protein
LRFHWNTVRTEIVNSGFPKSLEQELRICLLAESHGFDSVILPLSDLLPDPLLLSLTLSRRTQKLNFMVSCRPECITPAYFVQQVNTLSALNKGRVHVRIVSEEPAASGERSTEFVSVCEAFWSRSGPVNYSGAYYRVADGKIKTPFVSSHRQSPEVFFDRDLARLPADATAEAILGRYRSGARELVIEGRNANDLERFGREVLSQIRLLEEPLCN